MCLTVFKKHYFAVLLSAISFVFGQLPEVDVANFDKVSNALGVPT